jgi:hypothetical protein
MRLLLLIAALTPAPALAAASGDPVPALLVADAGGAGELLRTRAPEGGPLGWSAAPAGLAPSDLIGRPGVRFVAPVLAGRDGGWAAPTPTLILRARDRRASTAQAVVADLLPWAIDVRPHDELEGVVTFDLATPDGNEVLALAEVLSADARVEWAEPDWIIRGRSSGRMPDDPLFPLQWSHDNQGQTGGSPGFDMGILDAWEGSRGSSRAGVLVIDVGVELDHPDLYVGPSSDFTYDGGDGSPINVCDNHGTWVAGCISAIGNNGAGSVGVAPESPVYSARSMVAEVPLGFCSGAWTTQASWTVDALLFGRRMGAVVSVNSNAYGFEADVIGAAYEATAATGMVHFSSAGNFSGDSVTWPASLDSVLAVGAVAPDGMVPSFSNSGAGLALVAPGVEIPTTDRVGELGGDPAADHVVVDGTSFSAALAAGVASLMFAADPASNTQRVINGLLGTACDLGVAGRDATSGYGLIDAAGALTYALGRLDVLVPDLSAISLFTGGTQTLQLDAVAEGAGHAYLVLGSASGTSGGPLVGGVQLPLKLDNWFELCILSANQGPFGSTLGRLDRDGQAVATITLPPGLNPFLAGLTLHHTFLRIEDDGSAAQPPEPTPLRLEP